MARWGLAFLICVLAAQTANAEDAGLKSLSVKLAAIQGTHDEASQYDAGPELTPVKRALREWVEAQLSSLKEQDDPKVFSDRLNASLKAARLTCAWNDNHCAEPMSGPDVTQFNGRGYLSEISVSYLEFRHYLAVKTNVGIRCGFDESAYIYEWRENAWHLLLQTEQDRYDDKHYSPQNFLAIKASPTGVAWNQAASKPAMILTLGYSPWCSSNWQGLYTRLWRVQPGDTSPKPLIDTSDNFVLGDQTADARLMADDALIQYEGESIDSGISVRMHVKHFLIHDNGVERIAPVAFDPEQFVDEWLRQPWAESVKWSAEREKQRQWYDAFHQGVEIVFGEFDDAGPRRCRSDPTLWQIGLTEDAGPKNPELTGYFLVRWIAPYRFTLMDIRKEKSRDCDIADSMRDNVGTLFPFH